LVAVTGAERAYLRARIGSLRETQVVIRLWRVRPNHRSGAAALSLNLLHNVIFHYFGEWGLWQFFAHFKYCVPWFCVVNASEGQKEQK